MTFNSKRKVVFGSRWRASRSPRSRIPIAPWSAWGLARTGISSGPPTAKAVTGASAAISACATGRITSTSTQFGDVSDTCSGVYAAAAYTDFEWPYKNIVICTRHARFPNGLTPSSDILQTKNSDLQDLNILFTVGFRY